MHKYARTTWKIITVLFLCYFIYTMYSLIFYVFLKDSNFEKCDNDRVEIFVLTNGVHSDIVVPLENSIIDWNTLVDPSKTRSGNSNVKYVAFGWGEKDFYLNTPTWSDLKFRTAVKALFLMNTTAMHVTFYSQLTESNTCKKICVTQEDYKSLVMYIENSFVKKDGLLVLIKGFSYADNDLFYYANGRYNLFVTCNIWTIKALRKAGVGFLF